MTQANQRPEGRRMTAHVKGVWNRGAGGYAVILRTIENDVEFERRVIQGGQPEGVNNVILDMMAALAAIRSFPQDDTPVEVVTDSDILVRGFGEWIEGWRSKEWRNSSGERVKNWELWVELDEAVRARPVTFRKIAAHSRDPLAVEVMSLARRAAQEQAGKRFDLFFGKDVVA